MFIFVLLNLTQQLSFFVNFFFSIYSLSQQLTRSLQKDIYILVDNFISFIIKIEVIFITPKYKMRNPVFDKKAESGKIKFVKDARGSNSNGITGSGKKVEGNRVTIRMLLEKGVTPERLMKAGAIIRSLRKVGLSQKDLLNYGFDVGKLIDVAMKQLAEKIANKKRSIEYEAFMAETGQTLCRQMADRGINIIDLIEVGVDNKTLLKLGYSANEIMLARKSIKK